MLTHRRRPSSVPQQNACHRSGAVAVEMAIVLPVFLLLLGGIIEFGQGFMIAHSLSSAARRGARQAAMPGVTNANVETLVKTHCVNSLGVVAGDVTVSIKVTTPGGAESANLAAAVSGDACQVSVNVPFSKAGVSFFGKLLSGKTLTSTCTLERE
jgi:Flp pilus assembly protein TadG